MMGHFRRIFALTIWLCCCIVSAQTPPPASATPRAPKAVERIGQIDYGPISESSGLVASRKHPGVYWTHNDSGNPAVIFAITHEGKFVAEFPVAAKNNDWEDIAI